MPTPIVGNTHIPNPGISPLHSVQDFLAISSVQFFSPNGSGDYPEPVDYDNSQYDGSSSSKHGHLLGNFRHFSLNKQLVGGFNPSEKYWSNWIISPNRDENSKNV